MFLFFTSVKLLCAGGYYASQCAEKRKSLPSPSTSGRFRRLFLRRREVIASKVDSKSTDTVVKADNRPRMKDFAHAAPELHAANSTLRNGFKGNN